MISVSLDGYFKINLGAQVQHGRCMQPQSSPRRLKPHVQHVGAHQRHHQCRHVLSSQLLPGEEDRFWEALDVAERVQDGEFRLERILRTPRCKSRESIKTKVSKSVQRSAALQLSSGCAMSLSLFRAGLLVYSGGTIRIADSRAVLVWPP